MFRILLANITEIVSSKTYIFSNINLHCEISLTHIFRIFIDLSTTMLKHENKYQIISQNANKGTSCLKWTRKKHSQQIKCYRMF